MPSLVLPIEFPSRIELVINFKTAKALGLDVPLQLQQRADEAIDDPLTEVAREGARRMLAQVLIAEADSFIAMWKDLRLPDGRDRIVRQGHGPHPQSRPGLGLSRSVAPRCATGARWAQRRRSASPRRSCRSGRGGRRVLDALLPVLYLRAALTLDDSNALSSLAKAVEAINIAAIPRVAGRY